MKKSQLAVVLVFLVHMLRLSYMQRLLIKPISLKCWRGLHPTLGRFLWLKRNTETIMLEKNPWTVPESYEFSDSKVIPFFAEEELSWRHVS